MKHQQFQEWLTLSFYDELNPQDQELLNAHLAECGSCQKQKQELEKMQHAVHRATPVVSDELLEQARHEFRAALRLERAKKRWFESIRDAFNAAIPMRLALGAAAMLAVGLLIGYFAFHKEAAGPSSGAPVTAIAPEAGQDMPVSSDIQITNVRFEDADASDGEVEFSFEAVRPMKIKGSINDERVQKVLTYALVNAQNPGIRLRAVNALRNDQLKTPDQPVKEALLTALKTDENAGVRKQALEALQKFTPDQEIKDAFLHVLVKDTNPGMRVSAIKALESQHIMDDEVLDVLKNQLQEEENDFIRMRARAVIQEARQQQ